VDIFCSLSGKAHLLPAYVGPALSAEVVLLSLKSTYN